VRKARQARYFDRLTLPGARTEPIRVTVVISSGDGGCSEESGPGPRLCLAAILSSMIERFQCSISDRWPS
jgi:hypothetical protein